MLRSLTQRVLFATLPLVACAAPAFGHLNYNGRDFGIFTGSEEQSNTISGITTLNWSWADGTDADFMHTHRMKFFRFTLENAATVTISVASLDAVNMLPGFSLYSGLAHLSPAAPDYENAITFQYLASLGGTPKEGAFNALATWKMGNDSALTYDDFSTFTYVGNAADGTSLNFGSASGIHGDGVADGSVSSSFSLPAGSYTLAVGGAVYAGQGTTGAVFEGGYADASTTAYGMDVSVAVVPEPATSVLAAGGMLFLGMMRRRSPNSQTRQAV